eukprot:m.63607 g.63607  ORF g.63607 m.63607 type:complete len:341 (-) comp11590_c0_seq3:1285-2307(-)
MTDQELKHITTLTGHDSRVWACAWNPTGSMLASASGDATVKLWGREPRTDKWVCHDTLSGQHSRTIRSVCWSPCGMFLATASFDGTACVWDRRDGEFECTATLEGHENEAKCVSYSSTGQLLATCGRDKSVWIWEIDDDMENFDVQCISVLKSHEQDVKAIAWHPNKEIVVSCGYDDTIRLHRDDPTDWLTFDTLKGHTSTVWKIAFHPTGEMMASCSSDATVKIWRAYAPGNPQGIKTSGNDSKWKCVCTLSGYHDRPIYDIAWSSSGYLASCGGDNRLVILKLVKERQEQDETPIFELVSSRLHAHDEDLNGLHWNPGPDNILATASDDGTIKLWKVE